MIKQSYCYRNHYTEDKKGVQQQSRTPKIFMSHVLFYLLKSNIACLSFSYNDHSTNMVQIRGMKIILFSYSHSMFVSTKIGNPN